MQIAECYQSRQGEGLLTGTTSFFIRASGCNLRCGFCDTPYASWQPEGHDLSVHDIMESVLGGSAKHVVITGGEPMLFAELMPLCQRLKAAGRHVTIETAGTLYLPVECDLMSISPKMSNSTPPGSAGRWRLRHERTRLVPDVIRRLVTEYDYQLKFVVRDPPDVEEAVDFLQTLPAIARSRVWFMPEGTDPSRLAATAAWLRPRCQRDGYHYCPRRHIEWFGSLRGT